MKFRLFLSEATKEDFFNLAQLQRDAPEHAMLQVQHAMGGGVMNGAIEHVGDIIHRMSEKPTFYSAGYEYVKEKVAKTLGWLTSGYGFWREFEENLQNNASYWKIPVEDLKRKVYNALEVYAQEHEKLPTYNRAQKLAQMAAVSLGRRQFHRTIAALKMLQSHLVNRDEWIRFAHQGLVGVKAA